MEYADLVLHVSTPAVYRAFLASFRNTVCLKYDSGQYLGEFVTVNGCRVLKCRGKKKVLFEVHVVYSVEKEDYRVLQLFIQEDNLYVLGYSNGQQTFEFSGEELIPNSFPLKFGCSYLDLEGKGKLKTNVFVGREALRREVDNLLGTPDDKDRKYAIMTMIFHISEAVRFNFVEKHIVDHYQTQFTKISTEIAGVVNDWDHVSNALFAAQDDPTLTNVSGGKEITTLTKAKDYTSVILNVRHQTPAGGKRGGSTSHS